MGQSRSPQPKISVTSVQASGNLDLILTIGLGIKAIRHCQISNIIYLNSSVGVGFSYSKNQSDYTTGDLRTAIDTHAFLLKWFELYPEFLSNPFFIAGESYAGIYVPTLSFELVKGIDAHTKPVLNFMGYLVGKGVTDDDFDGNALVPFAHGMDFPFNGSLWKEAKNECKGNFYNSLTETCESKLEKVDRNIRELNIYNILEPCYHSPETPETFGLPSSFRKLGETDRPLAVRTRMFGRAWPIRAPVIDEIVPSWPQLLDSLSVQCTEAAIGEWELCTDNIFYNHDAGSMIKYHKNLTSRGYRELIYSGDHDMCVPFTGSEAWTRSVGYEIVDEWRPWTSNGQVAGYLQGYDHNLTFFNHKELLSGFRLSYQRKGKVYLLTDNEDVERFIAYISVSQDDVTLYVVNLEVVKLEEETDPACNDFDIGQYPKFDDEIVAAEEDVVDDNEEEVTTVNEHVEHPFCNSYNPEEEKEEEEIPEEKSPKKIPREYNWNMPELLQIPEEELVKIAVDCYTKIIRIKKDDCFDTKEDLKIALYTKCVEDGYQLKVNKSSKDSFETRVYWGHKIMTDMNARFKISISYSQAWRAKCYALELLRGSPEASFAQLPAYCHNLKLKNPGSVTHIKTDRDGRFELLFIAIGAAIRSFITCMRPVIIVDGAHLKGRYLGVNLLAVAMDANNGILPIAYGVGKSETSDSWTWFMGHLRDCIGPISNLTIISDRANSIDNVVRRCFPDAFHGLYGVHLYRNLKSRSAGIKNHKWTYWKAVKAYREVDFNKHINCLRRVLPQCAQTLEDVGFERWSRVHQLGARYGFMMSNSAESINALSRHSRKLPITMLMEFFRASIQQWNIGTSCYTMD
ncbi:Serine carboxypeptidase 1 [Hibiscus syriacus]|uniref:Serine carboxypeptidase 1 n=1 Tax=Hibiscus syriacus TaxID=106335 RepID=A0A6A2X1V7_HIBSY|nr:Serine carboxypeptidase 1 [Hibiscus syriacus]